MIDIEKINRRTKNSRGKIFITHIEFDYLYKMLVDDRVTDNKWETIYPLIKEFNTLYEVIQNKRLRLKSSNRRSKVE